MRRRASQCPHLSLPQLPESDFLALLCARLVCANRDHGRRRNRALPVVGPPRSAFCKKCGTQLFAWRKVGGTAGIALAAFDDRNALTPTAHIWMLKR